MRIAVRLQAVAWIFLAALVVALGAYAKIAVPGGFAAPSGTSSIVRTWESGQGPTGVAIAPWSADVFLLLSRPSAGADNDTLVVRAGTRKVFELSRPLVYLEVVRPSATACDGDWW